MGDLVVICPSHRRPKQARELRDSFYATRTARSEIDFLVWIKDPTFTDYPDEAGSYHEETMTARTNAAANRLVGSHPYIGWVADDNRFQTEGWDTKVLEALQTTPIVFGNDVTSPGSKPSHVFMDSRIVKSLGWLIHPGLRSTFFDDVWANLGVGPIDVSRPLFSQSGSHLGGLGIGYLDDVEVPHFYTERDNSKDFMADMETYQTWLRNDCEDDIGRARRAFTSHSTRGRSASASVSTGAPSGYRPHSSSGPLTSE